MDSGKSLKYTYLGLNYHPTLHNDTICVNTLIPLGMRPQTISLSYRHNTLFSLRTFQSFSPWLITLSSSLSFFLVHRHAVVFFRNLHEVF